MTSNGKFRISTLLGRDSNSGSRESERGSISILIFGLFFLLLSLAFVLTDLAAMVVAQRSLITASENAVMRGAQALDKGAYYRGNSGVSVPLDCAEARLVAMKELEAWSRENSSIRRPEITHIILDDFYCSGDVVEITTSGQLTLPFNLPGAVHERFELKAKVGAKSRRVN